MLELVEDQRVLVVELFDRFREGVELAAVNLHDGAGLVIDSAVTELEELAGQDASRPRAHPFLIRHL